ncbi:MAG: hypothetical protein NT038_09115 [Euryarchaeota archaeon]|nr:hypothetical protein [Euryarchaeota archaeon]
MNTKIVISYIIITFLFLIPSVSAVQYHTMKKTTESVISSLKQNIKTNQKEVVNTLLEEILALLLFFPYLAMAFSLNTEFKGHNVLAVFFFLIAFPIYLIGLLLYNWDNPFLILQNIYVS